MGKKWYFIFLTALFITFGVTLTACGNAPYESNSEPISPQSQKTFPISGNSITVNSSEQVTIIPDIATVIYSVQTQAAEAGNCSIGNVMSIIENSNYSQERYTNNVLKNSIIKENL